MPCFVYRSSKLADTYVYLRERDAFGLLPPELTQRLGTLVFALQVELTPGRKLAREDAEVVRNNLAARGFHVQLAPQLELPGDKAW